MRKNLDQIRYIAFDFDGVFYNTNTMSAIHEELHAIKVAAACQLHPDIFTPATASEIAHESRKEYGDSIILLARQVEQMGGDAQAFKHAYFTLFQSKAYEYFTQKYPEIFCHQPDLRSAFMQCRGITKHGIATNSCIENWAEPHLKTFGVHDQFVLDAVLGLRHSNFIPKGLHPMLFKMALDKMSANEAESSIVEDCAHNLELAKEHYPSLTTVFIHHGCPLPPKLPSHIDYQFRDVPEMLRAIATAHLNKQFEMI